MTEIRTEGACRGIFADLENMNRSLTDIARSTTQQAIARSADPEAYRIACNALYGSVSAVEGVDALHQALEAEGLGDDILIEIEGLYLKVLLGG